MADLSHDAVVAAFEKRYDYQSARNVLNQALKHGGLQAKDKYSNADLATIGGSLKALGEREPDVVIEALAGGGAAGGKADTKADDKKADDKKADDKKADTKKADTKKADTKKDTKKK